MSTTDLKMKRLLSKYKAQVITIILLGLLGCVSGISDKELFPIHARPVLPKALVEPEKAFVKCGDDYYCIYEQDLEHLRIWVISVQSLLNKYEHATEVLNN